LVGVLVALAVIAACNRGPAPPRFLPEVEGTIAVDGLSAPVRIVRDRWGIPHVYAESRHDAFVAQGFVQAEDRLFQMDLWRRSAQGRLAEVLGANFIDRDLMTRRLQYAGDRDAEWAGYGADAKEMASAFVAGINAWAAIAREQPPELFWLAGWRPDDWTADDLLNRTDAFDRQGTIADAEKQGLPAAVVDSVRRAAVPAFFTGLASPVRRLQGPTRPGGDANAPVDVAQSPARLYLIHLNTPNWNAFGATPPWRPGMTVGHDDVTSWARSEAAYRGVVHVERLDPSVGRTVQDAVAVKGRSEPFVYESQITPRGVVVATDRAAGRQFTLEWEGHRAGTAPAFARQREDLLRGGPAIARQEEPNVLFQHPLAISAAARERLNVGPLPRPRGNDPLFRMMWDPRVWDASRGMNAPGQAEWPASVHHSDLAGLWASGETVPLVYSESAVKANAEATLTLVPRRHR
jgi:penicillin G amidase